MLRRSAPIRRIARIITTMVTAMNTANTTITESNLTRRVDFALLMVEALENDELVHEAPVLLVREPLGDDLRPVGPDPLQRADASEQHVHALCGVGAEDDPLGELDIDLLLAAGPCLAHAHHKCDGRHARGGHRSKS